MKELANEQDFRTNEIKAKIDKSKDESKCVKKHKEKRIALYCVLHQDQQQSIHKYTNHKMIH